MTDQALAKSVMYDVQAAMGATFTSFWGWIWTESFGDALGEHRAIREGVGAVDVSSLIEWEWTGPDSLLAAQRLCTNDILGLSIGQIRYGPFLDADGKMIDDGTIWRLGDDRCWVMTNRWDLQEHFAEVTHGLDVTIKDVTLEMPLIQVQGPRSRELLSKLTSVDLASLKYFRFIPEQVEIGGVPVWIGRTGFTGELGFELFVSPADAPGLWSTVVEAGATPYGTAAANTQRIESGIVVYEEDYAPGALTPYDVSWDRLVALSRDFVGREALEGLADNPPRRMKTLKFEGEFVPEANATVLNGDTPVGTLTSPTFSPDFGVIGLAILEAEAAHEGKQLDVVAGDETRLRAAVHTLPIYDPDRKRPRM
jgi:aminomethyltransferase